MRVYAVLFCLSFALIVGCAKDSSEEKSPGEKSNAQQVIEGVTGKAAVDAGQRAKETLKEVGAKEQEDLDEVLNQ